MKEKNLEQRTDEEEAFDCPGFCGFTQKCEFSKKECVYEKVVDKNYFAFYAFYLLSEGRYSI